MKNYECLVCGKKYVKKCNLTVHIRNTGVRNYECEEYCMVKDFLPFLIITTSDTLAEEVQVSCMQKVFQDNA